MSIRTFLQIAETRGFAVDRLAEEGRCQLIFDDKLAVDVVADSDSLLFQADILKLKSEPKLRLQTLRAGLKIALALMKVTLSTLVIKGGKAEEGDEKGSDTDKSATSESGDETLCLIRHLETRNMPKFAIEQELEGFLSALEVYRGQMVKKKNKEEVEGNQGGRNGERR